MFYHAFDAHLSHCADTSIVCSVFKIMLRINCIKKQNARAFNIILDVTMKAVAF